jgi:hypothetical protein
MAIEGTPIARRTFFFSDFPRIFSKPRSATRNFLKPRNIIPGPKPEKHPRQT